MACPQGKEMRRSWPDPAGSRLGRGRSPPRHPPAKGPDRKVPDASPFRLAIQCDCRWRTHAPPHWCRSAEAIVLPWMWTTPAMAGVRQRRATAQSRARISSFAPPSPSSFWPWLIQVRKRADDPSVAARTAVAACWRPSRCPAPTWCCSGKTLSANKSPSLWLDRTCDRDTWRNPPSVRARPPLLCPRGLWHRSPGTPLESLRPRPWWAESDCIPRRLSDPWWPQAADLPQVVGW